MKYISRIITDLLLLNHELDFVDMHTYHYTDIIQSKLNDSNLFNLKEVAKIQKLFLIPTPSIVQIVSTINILNKKLEQSMKTYHD